MVDLLNASMGWLFNRSTICLLGDEFRAHPYQERRSHNKPAASQLTNFARGGVFHMSRSAGHLRAQPSAFGGQMEDSGACIG